MESFLINIFMMALLTNGSPLSSYSNIMAVEQKNVPLLYLL